MYFQKHPVTLIAVSLDERERVQKKTFTKWINSHLQRVGARVNELYHDLQDGRKLILLLEILSGEKLVGLNDIKVLYIYEVLFQWLILT